MKKVLTLVVLIITAVAFTSNVFAAGETEGEAGAAQKDTVLNFTYGQRPNNFDVFNQVQGVQDMTFRWVMGTLVKLNPKFEVIPDLAEDWNVSDDGSVWIFNLRQDATWQDGEDFDADDVIFTFEYGLKVGAGSLSNLVENIEGAVEFKEGNADSISGLEKIDADTVQITIKNPSAQFLRDISGVVLVPEHVVSEIPPENWSTSDMVTKKLYPGIGPYIFSEYKPDQYILFDKNEDYWRGEPKIPQIKFEIIKESGVALVGLLKGNLDFTPLDVDQMSRVEQEEGLETFTSLNAVVSALHVSPKAFPEKKFRQAVAYALDIDTIFENIQKGMGRRQSHPWYNEKFAPGGLNDYDYNPEMAKQLLSDIGWDSSEKVEFMVFGEDPEGPFIPVIQQQLKAVGINVEVLPVDGPAFIDKYYKNQEWELAYVGTGMVAFPVRYLRSFYLTGNRFPGGYNPGFSDPELDEIIKELLDEVDPDRITELVQNATRIMNDNCFRVYFWMSSGIYGKKAGLKINEGYNYQNWNDIQNWAFE